MLAEALHVPMIIEEGRGGRRAERNEKKNKEKSTEMRRQGYNEESTGDYWSETPSCVVTIDNNKANMNLNSVYAQKLNGAHHFLLTFGNCFLSLAKAYEAFICGSSHNRISSLPHYSTPRMRSKWFGR